MRRSQSTIFGILVFLLAAIALAAPPPKWSVALPDAGSYSYWVKSGTGAMVAPPTSNAHKSTVPLPAAVAGGDTLYVLDSHTGNVAAMPLTSPGQVKVSLGDFKTVDSPANARTAQPAAAASPAPHPAPRENPAAVFFSWLLGVIVAAIVIWFIARLVKTRGEPLIALARKAGVSVPDPTAIDPNAEAPLPLYEAPKPRVVEKIPEEAGVAAPPRPPSVRLSPLAPPTGAPRLVGTQGLAAGSTFPLTSGPAMIGRDGDNQIVLADSTVSRHHASLAVSDSGQIEVTDQGSSNGVYINGDRVQQAILNHGDELKIGDNYFRFEA